MTNRRAFLFGAAALLAAPAIVRADSIMRVVAPKFVLPEPWLFPRGQLLDREVYKELFAVVGTNYGPGDGKTTFALPDFRGRQLPLGGTYGPASIGQVAFMVRAVPDKMLPVGFMAERWVE